MTSLSGGVPAIGHHSSPPLSPPRPSSSSLYPPAYGPAGNNDRNNASQSANSGSSHGYPAPPDYGPTNQPSARPSLIAAEDASAKPKAKRKKTTTDDGKADSDGKTKRPRKLKDPNAPPPKRRVKKEDRQSSALSPMYPPSTGATSTPVPSASAAPKEHSKTVTPQADQFRAPPRPVSSGQRYDPVRGNLVDIPNNDRPPSSNAYGPVGIKSPVRSSASIANLIDLSPSSTHAPSPPRPQQRPGSSAYPSTANGISPSASSKLATSSSIKMTDLLVPNEPLSATRKVDSPQRRPSPKSAKPNGSTRDIQPPAPTSAPLAPLTNGDLGKPTNRDRKYEDVPNDCIVINVPIKKDTDGGNYINFLKEVENKYGFDVAFPRIAEHRKRMKEVAAAGAALESVPGSADEMNLDLSEAESDVEMGGQGEGSNSEGAKRKRRVNEKYDLDDDFIDDTEMIWQEQALASRDGYFVWSGPLIQEGDKPTIERADGTVKRGGRGGRGGGRGGATRGDGTRTRGRGGGPGSRGGQTVRKPRVTKADRARMESEKAEREKMAMSAAKPVLYPGTVG